MKPNSGWILLILVALLLAPSLAAQEQPANRVFGAGYNELKPEQRELFDELVQRYGVVVKKEVDPEQIFTSAPVSVRTTYDAVTHALLTTNLTDENGASLGTALDRVASLETIRGRVKGGRGDVQFRVYVLLKPNTLETLKKSREFKRTVDNTIYHKGYPISFRQGGGTPSIQFSISRDEKRADIDVDYRSSKFPAVLLNGHLTAANSDVRAGSNYPRHVNRWSGLANWWKDLLDFDLVRDLRASAAAEAEEDDKTIPAVPRKGTAKVHEAIADFLSALLVEGAANEAVAYVSESAYSCWELQGVTDGEPLNRGIAPYMALARFENLQKTLSNSLGKITDLKQVVRGVRLPGHPELRVIQQPFHDRFVLHDVPEGAALEWACSTRLTGEEPIKRDSKRYGKYFLAVFRIPPEGTGTTIALLLAKERGNWKIVTFEDEADVDYSNVPDLRPTDTEGRPLKTFDAPADLVRAIRAFHREWFVARYYSGALRYLSPEILSCRNLYLEEGEQPPTDLEQFKQVWREAMRKTVEHIGIHRQLSTAIHSVPPSTDDVAIVQHPNQDAFSIFAISDELGEAAHCVETDTENRSFPDELLQAPARGNYFAASFEVETAGGSPAALTTAWKKESDGWRIYAYRVDKP